MILVLFVVLYRNDCTDDEFSKLKQWVIFIDDYSWEIPNIFDISNNHKTTLSKRIKYLISKINLRKIIHRDNLIFWIVFSCSVIFFLSFNCEKQNQQKIQACLLLKFCQNWILGISGQKFDFSAKRLEKL